MKNKDEKRWGSLWSVRAKLVWDAPWSREQRFLVRMRNIPPASPLSFRLNEGGYRVVGQEAAHTYPVSVHEKYMWLIILWSFGLLSCSCSIPKAP